MSGYNLLYNVSTRGFGGLKNLQLKKKKSAKLSGPWPSSKNAVTKILLGFEFIRN